MILYYVMTKMIEDIQKCLTCKFEAPIAEWPILKHGKIKSLCEPCTIKHCKTCTNAYQVKLWKRKEDGELHDRCMCCRYDMVTCSKCSFKGIREEWKTKPDGSLYNLCPGCCEMFREAHHNISDNDRLYKNERLKDIYIAVMKYIEIKNKRSQDNMPVLRLSVLYV